MRTDSLCINERDCENLRDRNGKMGHAESMFSSGYSLGPDDGLLGPEIGSDLVWFSEAGSEGAEIWSWLKASFARRLALVVRPPLLAPAVITS